MSDDEYNALVNRLLKAVNNDHPSHRSLMYDAASALSALRAELAGAREDAARYRHIRSTVHSSRFTGPGDKWGTTLSFRAIDQFSTHSWMQGDAKEHLDSAIDLQLASSGAGK